MEKITPTKQTKVNFTGFINLLCYKLKWCLPNIYFLPPQHFIFLSVLYQRYLSRRVRRAVASRVSQALEGQLAEFRGLPQRSWPSGWQREDAGLGDAHALASPWRYSALWRHLRF